MDTKTCTECKIEKPVQEFHKHRNGYKPKCKVCRNSIYKAYAKTEIAKENARERVKRFYQKHSDKVKAYKKQYRKSTHGRGMTNAKNARYRAAKLQATPSWANLDKINEIYINCPEGYHVDHIIPLQGKTVCGLHVENNLQYLPAIDNIKKGNRY